jgi:uncharacterized protein (DUF58 family)
MLSWLLRASGAGLWISRQRLKLTRMLAKRAGRALPITLSQNRIYVLPSGFGVLLAGALFVAAFGALNYNNNLALAFSFLFCVLGFLSVHVAHRNLLRLSLTHVTTGPAYAGGEVIACCTFAAADARPRTCLQAYFLDAPQVDFELKSSSDVELRLATLKRGLLELPPISVRTEWPFGLFVVWSHLWPEQQAIVYPTPEAHPPALPESHSQRQGHAMQLGEEDLRHLRDYRPGDAPRRVAWKASAKRTHLLTRELEAPKNADIVLNWDATAGLDLEARLSRLTAWCLRAQAEQRQFELVLPKIHIQRASGPEQLHKCLRALALF